MKKFIPIILCGLITAGFLFAGDETVVLTRGSDSRKNVNYPVWDAIVTASHDVNDVNDVVQSVSVNGIIQKVILTIPDFTNGITGQVLIRDNEDRTIFDSGEQAKNASYAFSLAEPVTGTIDVVIGISGAAGGSGGSIIVSMRGI